MTHGRQPSTTARLAAGALLATTAAAMLFVGGRPWAADFVPTEPWDKLLHFFVFGGLAALSWTVLGGRSVLMPVLFVLFVGLVDEIHQATTPGRAPGLIDLGADVAGAVLAVALLHALSRRERRHSPRYDTASLR